MDLAFRQNKAQRISERIHGTLILVLKPPRNADGSFSLPLRRRMLVSADDGCVDHKVFEIWVFY